MHITNFIKNYLFTITCIVTFLFCTCSIIFPQNIYAQSGTQDKKPCYCERISCNRDVPDNINCIRENGKCKCPGPEEYTICSNSWMIECTKIYWSFNLSCCDKPHHCDPPNCDILGPNTPHECRDCVTYYLPRCMGCSVYMAQCDDPGSSDCGKCAYQIKQ